MHGASYNLPRRAPMPEEPTAIPELEEDVSDEDDEDDGGVAPNPIDQHASIGSSFFSAPASPVIIVPLHDIDPPLVESLDMGIAT